MLYTSFDDKWIYSLPLGTMAGYQVLFVLQTDYIKCKIVK